MSSCHASWLSHRLLSSSRHPLVVLLRQLVVALPLAVLSLHCPLVVLSRQLVVASPLLVLLLRLPLVTFPRVGIGRHMDSLQKLYHLVCFNRGISSSTPHHELTWSARTMAACPRQRSLAASLLHTCTFVTGDLNFPSKIWSKFVVHSPDPSEDTLKRCITTVLPSITTTHHDGGLPSPLSYTLVDDDPPLPSIPTQHSRRNLRDRRLFRNNGWTKWEAVQLADELEAKREMVKADWECWKEAGKQQEALDLQINGPFLFEWDDLSEEALRDADKHLRQR